MLDVTRVGIALNKQSFVRLKEICKKFDISQSLLFESFLTLSDDKIMVLIDNSVQGVLKTRTEQRLARKEMRQKISRLTQLSPKDLAELMAQAEAKLK